MSAGAIKARLEKLKASVPRDPVLQRIFGFQLSLEQSQWFPPEKLAQYQLRQLKMLAGFAHSAIPYWRERIPLAALEKTQELSDALGLLPVLRRKDLQDQGDAVRTSRLPPGQVSAGARRTSGSTGMFVKIETTNVAMTWQDCLTFRVHLWAGADFAKPLAVIRREPRGHADYPGITERAWDRAEVFPFPTGESFHLNTLTASFEQQWQWLSEKKPSHLVTYPSVLRGLAEMAAERGLPPTRLKTITTLGETVDAELRENVSRYLKSEIHDLYSSEECGTMAIQCPDSRRYHVQSETCIVEVLDDADRPVGPGESGRVAVTPLYNYATPLFRYDIGDFAESGARCACGRGLPVLTRILGRRRNMLTLADGRRFWPSLGVKQLEKIARIRQHQYRQTAPGRLEVWLVTDAPLSPEQEAEIRNHIARTLPAPMEVTVERKSEIPKPANGKYEEFISLVGV